LLDTGAESYQPVALKNWWVLVFRLCHRFYLKKSWLRLGVPFL